MTESRPAALAGIRNTRPDPSVVGPLLRAAVSRTGRRRHQDRKAGPWRSFSPAPGRPKRHWPAFPCVEHVPQERHAQYLEARGQQGFS